MDGIIYVQGTLSLSELASALASYCRTEADDLGNIETDSLSLSVCRNPDRGGSFATYEAIVEFETSGQEDQIAAIALVRDLGSYLRTRLHAIEIVSEYLN